MKSSVALKTMWRYRQALPIAGEPTVGPLVGFTRRAVDRLLKKWRVMNCGLRTARGHPATSPFKDRVVSVALSRAKELGFETVACPVLGNLANSVAANCAASAELNPMFSSRRIWSRKRAELALSTARTSSASKAITSQKWIPSALDAANSAGRL